MAGQDESSKPAPAVQLDADRQAAAPFWARIPRGWIIMGLFILAWIGIFLVWNGVLLVARL